MINKKISFQEREKVREREEAKIVKKIDKLYDRWRNLDMLTCFMAMLGLALAIIDVRIIAKSLAWDRTWSGKRRFENQKSSD